MLMLVVSVFSFLFFPAKTEKVLQQYVTNRTPEPWKCWYIKLYKLVTQISTHKVTE